MKKNLILIILGAILSIISILIVSCNLGGSNKFTNLLGSGSIGGGSGGGNGNINFPLFFDGQYQNDVEEFASIVPTSDGGYFAVGKADDSSNNIDDALFVKLDSNLNIVWSKLGSIGVRGAFGFENIENNNTYYYACGNSQNQDFFISKLNDDGSTNKIIYFSNYVSFILPYNNTNPGIIANIRYNSNTNDFNIAKFGRDLSFKWAITNAEWGEANIITSDNKTFLYFIDSNSNKYLAKIDVSSNDVNDVINNAQYYQITNNSSDLGFLGCLGDYNNNFYFGFVDYDLPQFNYIIKTDNNLNKIAEVRLSGWFELSLVNVPNSDDSILIAYDYNNSKLNLIKLNNSLVPIQNMAFQVSNYNPGTYYMNVIKAIPLANIFIIPGTFNNNALVYSFDYNLNPPCGSLTQSNLTLNNTNDISINTNPTTPSSTITSGSLTVNPDSTDTTDYPLTIIDACPIN
ncbi:MAG: hypothetical protein N2485_00055 [bacterium]|nr:hypothetical protein [bacterium]